MSKDLVRLMLTHAETEMLYRSFVNGLLGGDPRVRQSLQVKIEAARAIAHDMRAGSKTIEVKAEVVSNGKEAATA